MENPEIYSAFDKDQKRRISHLTEEFAEILANICGKCMDIGCGPGDITKEFLLPSISSNARLIGTDISECMIKYANEKFSDGKRLQFEVLDIQTRNLPEKYISEFDHIFSINALQWCSDMQQALENIFQMLRPNGTIFLNIVASHDIFEVLRISARDIRFAQYMKDMKDISLYQESKNPRKELKEVLQGIGFTVHHCSLRQFCFSDEQTQQQQFLKTLISVVPFPKNMPHDLMEEYKNVLTHEYMRRKIKYKSITNDQDLMLDINNVLVVYAQKIV